MNNPFVGAPNSGNGATMQNIAYVRWAQSMPDNLSEADLVAWMRANPAPPKIVPNVPPGVAAYIQQEVNRQVAAALAANTK
jgi:hypothetical protein